MVSQQGQTLTLIEIGHYPSEKWVIPALAGILRIESQADDWGIKILEDLPPGDPYIKYF